MSAESIETAPAIVESPESLKAPLLLTVKAWSYAMSPIVFLKLIPSLRLGAIESKNVETVPPPPEALPPIRKLQLDDDPQLLPTVTIAAADKLVVSFRSNSPLSASKAESPVSSNGLVIVALPETNCIIASPLPDDEPRANCSANRKSSVDEPPTI